ncbi:U2 small nuclear ribonucleoprotein A' [Frankliniella fusca]|uniref:Probable U2 small nuclear ribonucleoprotein A' n=1 Tax=Frankliniella fusca TaxID=407009 RepID=A0AAE1I024_9NEOP|nr:U2 small nuclear ribonucleoprotein A' [Frankliniella fusca]
MVKLTPDLINQSMQYINPVRDRELDLRGYKIPVIENMGATLDQFDTIDFSDNDIRKLDGFPLLKRLKCLLMNNNRIVRLSDTLVEQVPNLESLILTGNQMQELGDLDPLLNLKNLSTLSLLYNPVTSRPHYRLYLIYKLPQLKLLDFQKIKQKEREEAKALFKSKAGREIQREIAKKAKTFVPGAGLPSDAPASKGPSAEDLWKMREAISKASSLEEIERLNRLLQAGQIPGKKTTGNGKGPVSRAEEEEEEAMDTSQPSNGN